MNREEIHNILCAAGTIRISVDALRTIASIEDIKILDILDIIERNTIRIVDIFEKTSDVRDDAEELDDISEIH